MFSVYYDCCLKPSKHWKPSRKNIMPFINQYNWDGIDFPAGLKDWEKYERNNKTIALNILYIHPNAKTINFAYKSECNCKRENQVALLMITIGKQSHEVDKWYYIALKSERTDDGFNRPIRSLSRLFRGITSNNHGYFYCLGCLHSFRTDNALKNIKDCVVMMIIVMKKWLLKIIIH